MRLTAILLIVTLIASPALGLEADYVKAWCADKGQREYVLPDKTRVDCLTPEYAIEFDFGHKWAEAVGQSLHYALVTGLKPGIVLILKTPHDRVFLDRLTPLAEKYSIRVWTVK